MKTFCQLFKVDLISFYSNQIVNMENYTSSGGTYIRTYFMDLIKFRKWLAHHCKNQLKAAKVKVLDVVKNAIAEALPY